MAFPNFFSDKIKTIGMPFGDARIEPSPLRNQKSFFQGERIFVFSALVLWRKKY